MKRQKTKYTEMKWQMKPNGITLQSSQLSETKEERKNPLFSFLWKNLEKSEARYAWKNKCGLLNLFFYKSLWLLLIQVLVLVFISTCIKITLPVLENQ